MDKAWKYLPRILFGAATITIALLVITANHIIKVNTGILLFFRLITIFFFILFATRKKSLTTWILVSMIAGAEFGYDIPSVAKNLQVISDIFLRMIKTIIAPLLFSTLVVGIAGHADIKQIGRMGWKSLLYFEIVSSVALFIGLAAINISKAGVGVQLPPSSEAVSATTVAAHSTKDFLLHIFPENIAKAIFEGQILQIVVFSIIFGIAVAMVKEKYRSPMIRFTESLAEVMFKFTNLVMYFAPFAVFAAISYTIGHMGLDVLYNLFKLLATLYIALLVFLLFVLFPVALIFRIPVRPFIRAVSEPATIAFATSNSESALPSAMESMEKFGIPRKIVAFVIPTGYSFNLDGTTLYLSLATIFVAQAAGIVLPLDKQLIICFTLMLTSKGVAGVSRASLVILLGTAVSFGLPTEPIFMILGIDVLMDMARTSVNVIGNCLATSVVARSEKEFDDSAAVRFRAE
ncbi:MAG TPA: cation:dicarboxylase symporter family transporter [Bacteroidales bacterium]|jgi:proton glutamate symport protein|nr:cation:dicarboxylase symporter family transporter [Bacteroidales bacterium]